MMRMTMTTTTMTTTTTTTKTTTTKTTEATISTIATTTRLSLLLLFLFSLTSSTSTVSAKYVFSSSSSLTTPVTTTRQTSIDSVHIPLSGGLLHSSGFFFNATVGNQPFTLQVDLSYSSLIIPYKTCEGCRIGDRRYKPEDSKTAEKITCGDRRCHSPLDGDCATSRCFHCSPRGRCCVENDPTACAFNVLYGDNSSGNGTVYHDVLKIETISTEVLFGAMHEESHNFELPYADGVFGMGFQKGACRPTCFPPLMDVVTNSTGLQNLFSLCVGRYGGTLVLGKADESLLNKDEDAQYAYIDLIESTAGNPSEKYMVSTLPTWKIGGKDLSMPGITKAVWTLGITDIVITKTSFLALIQHLMEFYCDIPGLCSVSSWFRPAHCVILPDNVIDKMPNISIPFTPRVSITLAPRDYLLPYRNARCVAFVVSDSIIARGYGILLGSAVLAKYAGVFDRAKKRIGIAHANSTACGPTTGSDEGLPRAPGTHGDVLTADAPAVSVGPFHAPPQNLGIEESCRAQRSCSLCSKNSNCSYSYDNGKCVPITDAGVQPYPYCTGVLCACFAVGRAGWYFGIVLGIFVCLAIAFVIMMIWKKRQQQNFYRSLNSYEEQDLETF